MRQIGFRIGGQDYNYPADWLRTIETEDEVAFNHASGPCHLLCMIHSKWGNLWSRRIIEHHLSMFGDDLVAQNGQLVILVNRDRPIPSRAYNPMRDNLIFIKRNGWIGWALVGNLKRRAEIDEGWLLPYQAGFEMDLTDSLTLGEEIKQAFALKGQYPLDGLINAFDLGNRMLYPDALKDKMLVPTERDNPAKKTWISAICDYTYLIPNDVISLLPAEFK